ncbi:hypothetical protein HZI73_12560 [Vallitalea pronyensis]|uniref:Uncharacterized protein n=1 Tax=Vallitalea pronyensis TaxID=1348613 RepID=A0A8J8SH73_9FIRM|nr:hypothetical protein [Vallitalea pronyensis]QUI23068.1 hypothetical protein HZI73_12560 [Vallitalea pronyensis]
MNELNKEQRAFLNTHIKRSPKDMWQEELIRLRGIELKDEITLDDIEATINQWVLVETKDGGPGLRPYTCLCGRSIRYQFIVKHRQKDITYKLGSECIKKYTGIDGRVAKKVLIEQKSMNSEMDEILSKKQEGIINAQQYLLDYEALPQLSREQLQLGLPLTDKQLDKAFKAIEKDNHTKHASKAAYAKLRELKEQELAFINQLSPEDRRTLIIRLKDGSNVYTLDALKDIVVSQIATRQGDIPEDNVRTTSKPSSGKGNQALNKVKQALNLLSEEQRQFWGTRMSLQQRIETAPYILEKSHIIEPNKIIGKPIPSKLKQQIHLRLPLTNKQMASIADLVH